MESLIFGFFGTFILGLAVGYFSAKPVWGDDSEVTIPIDLDEDIDLSTHQLASRVLSDLEPYYPGLDQPTVAHILSEGLYKIAGDLHHNQSVDVEAIGTLRMTNGLIFGDRSRFSPEFSV